MSGEHTGPGCPIAGGDEHSFFCLLPYFVKGTFTSIFKDK
jgi:hypothetical protein